MTYKSTQLPSQTSTLHVAVSYGTSLKELNAPSASTVRTDQSLQSSLNSFPLLSLLNYRKLSIQMHHSPHPAHQDITSISRPIYHTTSSVNQIHPANMVIAAHAETELQHRLTLKAKITYSMNLCRMRYNL